MFPSAQIRFSVHKYIFECTNTFLSAQMFSSAQISFPVHKYIFECTNIFFSAQMFSSAQISFPVHKIIPGTQWAEIRRKTLGLDCH